MASLPLSRKFDKNITNAVLIQSRQGIRFYRKNFLPQNRITKTTNNEIDYVVLNRR